MCTFAYDVYHHMHIDNLTLAPPPTLTPNQRHLTPHPSSQICAFPLFCKECGDRGHGANYLSAVLFKMFAPNNLKPRLHYAQFLVRHG